MDREALARLVSSISRFLTPEQAIGAAAGARGGGAGLPPLGRGVDAGPGVAAARASGRRSAGSRPVAGWTASWWSGCCSRWWRSGRWSLARKLAATDWVAHRVAIEGCPGFSDDAAYRAMDFLLDALPEIAGEIFGSVATLLNLDLDLIFVDTTSTYWEVDGADDLADLQESVDDDGIDPAGRGCGPGVRALQGPPHRSAAGGDRDGGHPRRGAGAVLDVPRQHRRHRDHPHREGRPGRAGTCTGWCGSPTGGSPPRPTGPT